jgi:hypothetical protein
MPETVIRLRVLRRGARVDELLFAVARGFERDELRPDDTGLVTLRIPDRGPSAWDAVREALDHAGSDWREWLHLAPRPRR